MSKKESVIEQPTVDESGWKQELEQLDRLLTGRLTQDEAKEYAQSELARHDGIVHTIETQIAHARSVLTTTSFLPSAERKRIANRIESLEHDLTNARRLREGSIRKCGAGIRDSKDADKLRPRWQELCKRQQAIDVAIDVARGRGQELKIQLPRRFVG